MGTLNWGLVGGGEGSQIGPAHRIAARLDGRFTLSAGALDHVPDAGRAFGQKLGISPERAYGDWREMLASECDRDDRVHLVTVATPNVTHFEISKAFLEAGFHVLCEKPVTMNAAQALELSQVAERADRICAVNYGYSGYPLVRQMRAMVAHGDLGQVRLVRADFAHGHHSDAADLDNPRVRWRYDRASVGPSAQFADCGIHALHLACFVTGQSVTCLSADFASCIAARQLEDDAMVNFRMDKKIVGRLWTSSVALGRQHGLGIEIFGEKAGLRWTQEQPNQLFFTPLGKRTQIIERGDSALYPEAARGSRVTVGHVEGFPEAFANIYLDLAELIDAKISGRTPHPTATHIPSVKDGLASMRAIEAAVSSAAQNGAWVDLPA